MTEKDIKLNLLSGTPVKIGNIGSIYPMKLKEIAEIGEKEYNEMLSLLLLDKNNLKNKEGIEQYTSFEFLVVNSYHSEEIKSNMENALSLFFREKVYFLKDLLAFQVGEDFDSMRFIYNENYEEITTVLKLQNNVSLNSKKEAKPKSKKQEMLIKKREQGRELLAKAKGQADIALGDLVSAMGVFTNDLNTVLDMTVYQFYNQYERYMKRENYNSNFEMVLVGADAKKLNLDKHWTSK